MKGLVFIVFFILMVSVLSAQQQGGYVDENPSENLSSAKTKSKERLELNISFSPFDGMLYIKFEETGVKYIEIYDIFVGQEPIIAVDTSLDEVSVELSQLKKGIHILKVRQNNKVGYRKFVVP